MKTKRIAAAWLLLVSIASNGESQGLRSRIQKEAARTKGRVGVACSLPGVTLDCGVNSGVGLPMQSVYKLPIAMAMLDAVEKGQFRMDQEVPFLPSDPVQPDLNSPLRDEHPHGGVDVKLDELVRFAVEHSDGTASDILLRLMGGPYAADAYVRRLGIEGIHIRDSEAQMATDVRIQYRDDATAAALVALLRRLADRSPLNVEHTALLLQMMTDATTGPHRIRGLLPPGTEVAHKTGTSGTDHGLTHATNDIGLITMPDGRRLAIAVLVCDSPESEVVREEVIAKITRSIYDAANPKSH